MSYLTTHPKIGSRQLLALIYTTLVMAMVIFLSHTSYAAFSGMPTNLAADGREDSSNPAIVHLSRVGNDATGNGGLLQTTTIKVYYPGDAPPIGDAAKIFVDRIQGSCDLVAYVNGSSGELIRYNTAETCNIMKFQLPSTTAVWKSLSTTEGNFRVATITFKLSDAGEDFNEDPIQDTANSGFRRTIDINHFSSFNGSRLGFAGGKPVTIDTNSGGGLTWGFTLAFGVPCNASATNSVTWRDDDQGLDPQHGYVMDTSMSNADTGNVVGSNPSWGGKGLGSMAVSLNSNNRYDWNWTDVYKGNAIRIYYPYDTAWYYLSCLPKSWELADYSYISSNGYNLGDSHGQISRPEDGPAPGENFQFINDIRNNGERAVSDGFWRCLDNSDYPVADTDPDTPGHQTAGWSGGANNSCKDNPDGRAWWLKDNTEQIVFDRSRTGYVDDTFACIGTGVTPGNLLYNNPNGAWNWWDNNAVRGVGCSATPGPHDGSGGQDLQLQASDGGRTICQNGSYYPRYAIEKKESSYDSTKTTGWTLPHDLGQDDRAYMSLCLQMPYYYNLTPELDVGGNEGGTIQQGDDLTVTGEVSQPSSSGGRNHTYSQSGKDKGIVQFRFDSGETLPTALTGGDDSVSPLLWCANRASAAACSTVTSKTDAVGIPADSNGTLSIHNGTGQIINTETLAVGTKLCYATYVQHPKNTTNSDVVGGDSVYRYSDIECAVVTKAPKIQFLRGDVSVGRKWSTDTTCTGGTVTDAPIVASGAPNAANTKSSPNYYGSWVEYGALATGEISGLGSGASPYGLVGSTTYNAATAFRWAKQLTFANTDGGAGEYAYGGNWCLQNPFARVTSNSTNIEDIKNSPVNQPDVYNETSGRLQLNELAEKVPKEYDKTGYTVNGSVNIAPPNTDVPPTVVEVVAKSQHDTTQKGCPKIRIQATDKDNAAITDQDTKCLKSTDYQTYTYNMYLGPNGPGSIDLQFVNDAWGGTNFMRGGSSNFDRDVFVQSITINGKEVYKYDETHPGVTYRGDWHNSSNKSLSCNSASEQGRRLIGDEATSLSWGAPYPCYGISVGGIDAKIPLTAPSYNPVSKKVRVTVSASANITNNIGAYGGAQLSNNGCPHMGITVKTDDGQYREDVKKVCAAAGNWQDYTFDTNIGKDTIDWVSAMFDAPDGYGGGAGNERDLFVRSVRVEYEGSSTSQTYNTTPGSGAGNIWMITNSGGAAGTTPVGTQVDKAINDTSTYTNVCNTNGQDYVSLFAAEDSAYDGHCLGVKITNVVALPPPPPPTSILDENYDGFAGRSIVIYAKKPQGDSCSNNDNAAGNIVISQNIDYKKDGFTDVTKLPRIVIMADCNIRILDNVTKIRATLIAGDAIKTCTTQARTKDECTEPLYVRGAVSAKRLLLWRTANADLTDTVGATTPAESFDLSPSQMIAGYSRDSNSSQPRTVYEKDLPPRY